MKIKKIQFKNINALKGEHEIDFSAAPLSGSQLFAITGPTGSGKSTLLDVMALALFNQVPRLGKISKRLIEEQGALMTRNTDQASASVEYISKGMTYRSHWEISTNRNGNLKEYEMRLENLTTVRSLDFRKSEVPGANEELIGLSYDQFIKSILLAQGEFAQFLNAKKADRGALLEKITGTGIYRQLGMRAFEKMSQFGKVLKELQNERDIVAGKLLDDEVLAEKKQAYKKMGEELEKMVEKEGVLRQQIQLRQELKAVVVKVENQEKEVALKGQILREFEEQYRDAIKGHEATLPFAEALGKYQTIEVKIREMGEGMVRLRADFDHNESQQLDLQGQIGRLLKRKVDAGQVIEALTELQKKVEAIEKDRSDCRSEYFELFAKLEAKELGVDFSRRDPPAAIRSLMQSAHQALSEEVSVLEGRLQGLDLTDLEGEAERLSLKLSDLNRRGVWLDQFTAIRNTLEREGKERDALTARLVQIPLEVQDYKKRLAEVEAEYKLEKMAQNNLEIRERLTELRAELKEGEPCPLCGSEEHPWSIEMPEEGEHREGKLEVMERNQKELTGRISDLNAELRAKEEQLEGVKKRLEEQEKSKRALAENIRELEGKWGWSEDLDGGQFAVELGEQRGRLNEYGIGAAKIKAMKESWILLDQLEVLYDKGVRLKEEKNRWYEGDDIAQVCEKYRSEWNLVGDRLSGLNKQMEELGGQLAELKSNHEALVGQLQREIQAAGWESIEQVRSQRMGEQEYSRLKDLESQNRSSLIAAESSLTALKQQSEELASKCTDDTDEKVDEDWQEIKGMIVNRREETNEVKRQLDNHSEDKRAVLQLEERIEQEGTIGHKWVLLNELIGDKTGRTFNDYAQELTLQRLLVWANHRLAGLTDRYLLDIPLENEEADGLMVVDDHMGGQRRSVKTLSGGETFLMSLSLALALSDLAAKNVAINSLFIDEGFGTLDPETLDQTIDTLERLQMESEKTIGIISHVEALKERIGTQIQLERNGQGYSSLKVVG